MKKITYIEFDNWVHIYSWIKMAKVEWSLYLLVIRGKTDRYAIIEWINSLLINWWIIMPSLSNAPLVLRHKLSLLHISYVLSRKS